MYVLYKSCVLDLLVCPGAETKREKLMHSLEYLPLHE